VKLSLFSTSTSFSPDHFQAGAGVLILSAILSPFSAMEPLEMESVVPVDVCLPREAKMLRGLKEPAAGGAACCILDGKGNVPDSTSLVDLAKLPLPFDHGRAPGEIGSPALSSCSTKKSVLFGFVRIGLGITHVQHQVHDLHPDRDWQSRIPES
jgi:hypothetical protein